MQIVDRCGTMWARNTNNIARIPGSGDGGQGVYILLDGSMPVYVGKGEHPAADHKGQTQQGARPTLGPI